MRHYDLVLVEKGEPTFRFKDPLNDEHDIRPSGVVFVEYERHPVPERPRKNPLLEFRYLLAVAELDRILADQVDARNVAVQVDPDAGPVQAGGNLFDVRRLAGSVIALDHDTPVVREPRQDRERGVGVELVGRVKVRNPVRRLLEGHDLKVGVDAEGLPHQQPFRGFRNQIQS